MSRHAAALRSLLATYRIDTPRNAFASIAPHLITAIIVAWGFPAEFWGKFLAGAIASLIVLPILYVWTFLTLEPNPPLKVGFSSLYTAVGRRQLRAEQRAKDDEIARLSFESQGLAAAMAMLDVTTDEGQRKLKQLADQKKTIDEKMAELEKLPKPRLGFIAGD
ncbi:hypothetical protein [Bradyrhizobium sp. URHD0069]|uniref:hypothetical protein n=1 Tax=Bradyrhizobium sp. URHD0069 TaxID=1380355 RepID=UPI00049674B0|nr:hypothetical protein [Bradyrhizobium sp. URHD0069]